MSKKIALTAKLKCKRNVSSDNSLSNVLSCIKGTNSRCLRLFQEYHLDSEIFLFAFPLPSKCKSNSQVKDDGLGFKSTWSSSLNLFNETNLNSLHLFNARYRVWDLYWISTKSANQPRQNSNQELTKLDSRVTVAVMVVQIKATKPITVLPAKAKSRQPGKSVRTRQAQSDILLTPSQSLTIRGSGTSAQRKLWKNTWLCFFTYTSSYVQYIAPIGHSKPHVTKFSLR